MRKDVDPSGPPGARPSRLAEGRADAIALVGLPGAGKSTVGRRLADLLHLPFLDTDAEVERLSNSSISTLFETEGEHGFRARERAVIRGAVDEQPKVIALGGGAWLDPETRSLLLDRVIVIWLDAPEDVLVERLSSDNRRPLFQGVPVRQTIRKLAAERMAAYSEAHFRVFGSTSEELVQGVLERLDSRVWDRRSISDPGGRSG